MRGPLRASREFYRPDGAWGTTADKQKRRGLFRLAHDVVRLSRLSAVCVCGARWGGDSARQRTLLSAIARLRPRKMGAVRQGRTRDERPEAHPIATIEFARQFEHRTQPIHTMR